MKIIQKTFKLNRVDYNSKHLEIISCLVPTRLTEKEIEVLAHFMSLDKAITEGDMFNTLARKRVMKALGLQAGGLGNHLKHMIDKKVLIRDGATKKITMQKFLTPNSGFQGYQLKILKDEK